MFDPRSRCSLSHSLFFSLTLRMSVYLSVCLSVCLSFFSLSPSCLSDFSLSLFICLQLSISSPIVLLFLSLNYISLFLFLSSPHLILSISFLYISCYFDLYLTVRGADWLTAMKGHWGKCNVLKFYSKFRHRGWEIPLMGDATVGSNLKMGATLYVT